MGAKLRRPPEPEGCLVAVEGGMNCTLFRPDTGHSRKAQAQTRCYTYVRHVSRIEIITGVVRRRHPSLPRSTTRQASISAT